MLRLTGMFLLNRNAYDAVYAPAAATRIAERVDINTVPQSDSTDAIRVGLLEDVDVLFSGWGAPKMDEAFLAAAPNLKAVFYAAGSINVWATPALWERNIVVTTANHANAVPVAEYTVATTMFSLKHGWRLMAKGRAAKGFEIRPEVPGAYRSVVGLVGMGTIARLVVSLLQAYDVRVIAYDPYCLPDDARRMGVECVSLDELFAEADVVSLHAPDLPSTRGLITGKLLSSMKTGATFINTSRGRIVCEDDLVVVLRNRPDLHAVLDVTQQEPLPAMSPLNFLDNVVLTPHIAGSQGRECERMGQYMVDELDRYLAGRPLLWQVRPTTTAHSVHQLVVQ